MRAAPPAKGGHLNGNDAAEAVYPLGRVDVNGKDLDTQASTLTTPHLRPQASCRHECVLGRWTCYDGKSQLMIKNPDQPAYLIPTLCHGQIKLKKNVDGSVDLHPEAIPPGKGQGKAIGSGPDDNRPIWSCVCTAKACHQCAICSCRLARALEGHRALESQLSKRLVVVIKKNSNDM